MKIKADTNAEEELLIKKSKCVSITSLIFFLLYYIDFTSKA